MNPDSPPQPSKSSWIRWLGPLLFLVAFGFRLAGIGWGLPNALHNQSYHPDEQVIWQFSQGVEPASLDFAPGKYNYGTLYLTVLRVASDMVAAYTGGFDPAKPDTLWAYMARCHQAGRWLNALFGAGVAWVVFAIVRRFGTSLGATLAGLSVAFAPALVVHSRFQTTDMLATLLFAGSLAASLKLLTLSEADWDRHSLKIAMVAGLLAGLSAGAKYTGILALATLVAAAALTKRGWLKPSAAGLVAAIAGFVVATPGILVDSERFWRDFQYEAIHTSTGHGLLFTGVANGFAYQVANLLTGFAPLAALLGLIGLAWGSIKREPALLALLPTFLLYFILIGRAEVLFMRYTFPLMVLLAVGFGWLASKGRGAQGGSTAIGAVSMLAVGASAIVAGRWTESMVQPDPRDQAALFLKASAKEGETVGLATDPWYYTPPLFPNTAIVRGLFPLQMEEARAAEPQVLRYTPDNPDERIDWDVRLFGLEPDYVVFSNFEAGDVARLIAQSYQPLPPEAERFRAFLARLQRDYTEISPGADSNPLQRYALAGRQVHDMAYVRPNVYLWKRKSESTTP